MHSLKPSTEKYNEAVKKEITEIAVPMPDIENKFAKSKPTDEVILNDEFAKITITNNRNESRIPSRMRGSMYSNAKSSGSASPTSTIVHPTMISVGKSIGDYRLGKTIGAGNGFKISEFIQLGATGKVKIGINVKTGHKYAIKIIAKSTPSINRMSAREARIRREECFMRLLRHPNIVCLRDSFETPEFHFMVFDFVSGGQMLDYIISHGRLKEKVARKFFRQLVSAIAYCHNHGIVHRDLKIENILIDQDETIKLIDFGLSNLYDMNYCLKTFCGSLYFAAPELLSGKLYIGPEVDIWSLGVILYVLTTGKVPFDDKNLPNLHEKIKTMTPEYPEYLSSECQDLLRKMLCKDPVNRITMDKLMYHSWIIKGEGEIVTHSPDHAPLDNIDESVSSSLVNELRYLFSPSEIIETLKNSIVDWPQYCRNPIVLLYFLNREKVKEVRKLSVTQILSEQGDLKSPITLNPPEKLKVRHGSYFIGTDSKLKEGPRRMTYNREIEKKPNSFLGSIFRRNSKTSKGMTRSATGNKLNEHLIGGMTRSQTLGNIKSNDVEDVTEGEECLQSARSITQSIPFPTEKQEEPAIYIVKSVTLKGLFSVNTTTTRDPRDIRSKLIDALRRNAIPYDESPLEATIHCEYTPSYYSASPGGQLQEPLPPIQKLLFDIAIVKISILNMYGVQFRKLMGDSWVYKNVCGKLLKEMSL